MIFTKNNSFQHIISRRMIALSIAIAVLVKKSLLDALRLRALLRYFSVDSSELDLFTRHSEEQQNISG
jgi:hypothetical protein